MILNVVVFAGLISSFSPQINGVPVCGQTADGCFTANISQTDPLLGNSTCSQLSGTQKFTQCGSNAIDLISFLTSVAGLSFGLTDSVNAVAKPRDDRKTSIDLSISNNISHNQQITQCNGIGCCNDPSLSCLTNCLSPVNNCIATTSDTGNINTTSDTSNTNTNSDTSNSNSGTTSTTTTTTTPTPATVIVINPTSSTTPASVA